MEEYRLLTLNNAAEWEEAQVDTDLQKLKDFAAAEVGSPWIITDRCGFPEAVGDKRGERAPEPLIFVVFAEIGEIYCTDYIPAFTPMEAEQLWKKSADGRIIWIYEARELLTIADRTREVIQDSVGVKTEWQRYTSFANVGNHPSDPTGSSALVAMLHWMKQRTAYALIQEGGTSMEKYVHSHTSIEEAKEDRKSCDEGAYRTSEPHEHSIFSFNGEDYMKLEDAYKLAEDLATAELS
jgi:hypothetical protein